MKMPDHVTASAIAMAISIARCGFLERYAAVAAGVTIREKISSTPVTWIEKDTATASRIMKAVPRKSIGKPLASATSSSSDAKSSGL